MTDEWKQVHGVLMTDQEISAYGGFAVSKEFLDEAAASIRDGSLPMHLNHDLTEPIRVRRLDAFVQKRADGVHELRFTAEMHPDDLGWLDTHQGMSLTLTTPLGRDSSHPRRSGDLELSADHAWFSDEALIEAETALLHRGIGRDQLTVERAYQFSFTPDPQIFVLVILPVLTSIGAAALWDAVKLLFLRRRTPEGGDSSARTVINVTVANGDRSLTAQVATSSDEVAERAFDSLDQAVAGTLQSAADGRSENMTGEKHLLIWDEASQSWRPASGS